MDPGNERSFTEQELRKLSKQDLIRLILDTVPLERQTIPVSAFTTSLSPLESICRYLHDHKKKVKAISEFLHRHPSSVSEAITSSKKKKFVIGKTSTFIPLSYFETHTSLSILEVVVNFLRTSNMKFVDIAQLLKRDPKTVWTVHNRAKKKLAARAAKHGGGRMNKHRRKSRRGDTT